MRVGVTFPLGTDRVMLAAGGGDRPRMAGHDASIPVLDLRVADGDPAARARFRAALHDAATGVGFFHLVGHGVPAERVAQIRRLTRAFFALPESELTAISNLHSPHFRGYTRIGHEHTNGSPDWRDQLDVALEQPARPPADGEPAYRWLHGPNQWPAALPELKPVVLRWMADLSTVAARLLAELVESLGAPGDFFADAFRPDPHVHLKLIRYPGSAPNGSDQGVGTHKDYGFLTLLLTDSVGGLQVVTRDGEFLDVPPRTDAFVVNLGELLEVATRGHLVATRHRVTSPPPGATRYSVALFYNPRLDYLVRPLPIEPVADAPGAGHDPANPLFDVYGRNALKGWLRAHPEVARRHHPDLLGEPS